MGLAKGSSTEAQPSTALPAPVSSLLRSDRPWLWPGGMRVVAALLIRLLEGEEEEAPPGKARTLLQHQGNRWRKTMDITCYVVYRRGQITPEGKRRISRRGKGLMMMCDDDDHRQTRREHR